MVTISRFGLFQPSTCLSRYAPGGNGIHGTRREDFRNVGDQPARAAPDGPRRRIGVPPVGDARPADPRDVQGAREPRRPADRGIAGAPGRCRRAVRALRGVPAQGRCGGARGQAREHGGSRAARAQADRGRARRKQPAPGGDDAPDRRGEGRCREDAARRGCAPLRRDRRQGAREARGVKPLFTVAVLAVAVAAGASEEAAGHAVGIPWTDLLKQVVNFAILVGALVYFLKKPISSFLSDRSEQLRKSIEDSARAREEAAAKLSDIEKRMAGLPDAIAALNRKMEAEGQEEARRIREAAEAEIERVWTQARFAAEQEVKKARQELRREAAGLAIAAAEEIVTKSITAEDRERLARENIEKIREIAP